METPRVAVQQSFLFLALAEMEILLGVLIKQINKNFFKTPSTATIPILGCVEIFSFSRSLSSITTRRLFSPTLLSSRVGNSSLSSSASSVALRLLLFCFVCIGVGVGARSSEFKKIIMY